MSSPREIYGSDIVSPIPQNTYVYSVDEYGKETIVERRLTAEEAREKVLIHDSHFLDSDHVVRFHIITWEGLNGFLLINDHNLLWYIKTRIHPERLTKHFCDTEGNKYVLCDHLEDDVVLLSDETGKRVTVPKRVFLLGYKVML